MSVNLCDNDAKHDNLLDICIDDPQSNREHVPTPPYPTPTGTPYVVRSIDISKALLSRSNCKAAVT